jgi:thioredoxin reductase
MMRVDVLIVGAGPASLAAAEVLANYDINITIVDEQARPGGQIYRQPPQQFKVQNWLSSHIYASGKKLLKKVSGIEKIQWLTQTTVLGVTKNNDIDSIYIHKVTLSGQSGTEDIEAKCVLIAPGCHDMSVIFPGWTTPGVMATGGIQAFVKSQQLIPGDRFLFAGTHPLQLIVADQIVQAGGRVTAVIFAQPLSRVFALIKSPLIILRHASKFIYLAGTLLRLIRAGVSIKFAETIVQANGDEVLTNASIASVDGSGNVDKSKIRNIECDRLGICFSFLASSELARQSGAKCSWSNESGGWIIDHDEWMLTNVKGIYVAGEITGVAGAEVAIEEGRLAGLGIMRGLGLEQADQISKLSKPVRTKLLHLNQFADMLITLSYPGNNLLEQLRTSESTLCKCEEITVDEFNSQLSDNPYIGNANAAKLLSRTGMGLCQGRYCQYHITQMLAQYTSTSEEEVGSFTSRFPTKPVKISELIK